MVLKTAIAKNVHYLRHYINLHKNFEIDTACFKYYRENFIYNTKASIVSKATLNEYSIYNDFLKLNSDKKSPEFYHSYSTSEPNRMIVTKYRTGSHYLHINTRRTANIPRTERLCKCLEIQTLHHVIFDCIYTRCIQLDPNIQNLKNIFELDTHLIAGVLIHLGVATTLINFFTRGGGWVNMFNEMTIFGLLYIILS